MTDYVWPDDLVPYAMSFWLQPHTGGSESPFSRQTKVYGLSAPRWVCRLSLRAPDSLDRWGGDKGTWGEQMDALLAKLEGRSNRVQVYDFRRPGAARTFSNAAVSAGSSLILLTGASVGDIREGEYIGGDGRPHIITALEQSGSNLIATVKPPFAAAIGAGEATYEKVAGTFRLVSDDAGQNPSEVGQLTNYELDLVEDFVAQESLEPYLGLAATRGIMTGYELHTSFKQLKVKTFHYARTDISSLKLIFQNNRLESETGNGATTTISASIEYNGVRTRVQFSGSNNGSMANGASLLSDTVTLPETIPEGAKFFIHQFLRNSSGYNYSPSQTLNAAGGDKVQFAASGLTDTVMTSDPVTNTSVIPATPGVLATTTKPSFLLIGDSKADGAGDGVGGNSRGDIGEFARSIGQNFAYLNVSAGGERAYNATFTKRLALSQYASHVLANHGINDVRTPYSFLIVTAGLTDMWIRFSGQESDGYLHGATTLTTSSYFWGMDDTPSSPTTIDRVYLTMSAAGTYKIIVVDSSNVVFYDRNFSCTGPGPVSHKLNLAVGAGSRVYVRPLTGGALGHTPGVGANKYIEASSYNGVIGDTVVQQSGVAIMDMRVTYGSPLRKVYQATIAPSNITGTPESTNAVRVAVNNYIRSRPAPLSGSVEIADVVETVRGSGLWKTGYTTDLIHENETGYQAIEAAGEMDPDDF